MTKTEMTRIMTNDVLDGGFKQGLWGCFTDSTQCALTCLFPFYAIAKNAEAVGEKIGIHWMLAYATCPFCAGAIQRGQIRKGHKLAGGFCTDLFVTCLCGPCALVQETAQTGSMKALIRQVKGDLPVTITIQPK